MKYRIMGFHYLLWRKRSSENETILGGIYNLCPLDIYIGPAQFIVSNQKKESISAKKG